MAETKYYLTRQGLERAQQEYQELLALKKQKTSSENVPSILHSEEVNPDYLAFQEDLSLLEARLNEYNLILSNAEVITPPKGRDRGMVVVGSRVVVGTSGGATDEFEIVGTIEANPAVGKISNESPVGSAFLGKRIGEVVEIFSPKKVVYRITNIQYIAE